MKRNFRTNLMNEARRKFYSDLIAENSSNQRNLFSAAKRFLNQGHQVLLPPTSDKFVLANEMGSFFVKKIIAIQVKLDRLGDCLHDSNFNYVNTSLTTTLDNFIPLRWPKTCAFAGESQRAHKDFRKKTCRQKSNHFIYSTLALSVLVPVSRTSFVLLRAALFSLALLCFGSLVCQIYSLTTGVVAACGRIHVQNILPKSPKTVPLKPNPSLPSW